MDVLIDAPPHIVWSMVGDVRRLPEWSPQVRETTLLDGAVHLEVGVRFVNHNESGPLAWTTHGEIVHFEPCRAMAFRLDENWLVWSFTLEETPGPGTRLVQRREAPDGISDHAHGLTQKYMGGTEAFTRTMRAGMRQTLQGIKAACEQGAPAHER
ncbi:polyketide cyclase [Mobilicoccus caccae]|uniref:Polyketide cyclase n=1 Tax=Mobilicoccus caccae TaxID=1859295 RepID=A0ABQ6IJX8_9MICO|nr:polyketide cyclase [Mobilicoccus caccae]